MKRYQKILIVFLSLGVLEYWVFSASFSEFFQGDALFWLQHRYRGWTEFFGSFFGLDVAHWYRPLTVRTIPGIFFHWFGMNPYGYHWVIFLLFFLCTCIVFLFLFSLTSSLAAASFGTLFFAIHSINTYVTSNLAIAPDLFYASFYLLTCVAFIRRKYWLSISLFVLALMSKEAAVTLPGILVLLILFADGQRSAWKMTLPFFGILAIYYAIIVHTLKVGAGDYVIALNKDIPIRLVNSFSWAFNFMGRRTVILLPMIVSTLFIIVVAIALSFTARRKLIFLGFAWFVTALSPMLGIVGYFAAYYLFLPMVGIAIVVGVSLEWLYTTIRGTNQRLAVAVVGVVLLPFLLSARINAQMDVPAIAAPERIARQSALDLKASNPTIPHGATVLILNNDEPDLWRWFGLDSLVRLTYADDSTEVLYSSVGYSASDDLIRSSRLIVMKYQNGRLMDVTLPFKTNPHDFLESRTEREFQYATSDRFALEVLPHKVIAGKDSYAIRISGLGESDAELQYRFDEGPLAFITVHLNAAGTTKFFVSSLTKRGSYRFIGFKIPSEPKWIGASQIVVVADQ